MKIKRKEWQKLLRPLILFSQHMPNARLFFEHDKLYTEGSQGFALYQMEEPISLPKGSVDCTLFTRILSNSKSPFLNLEVNDGDLIIKENETHWVLPYKSNYDDFVIGEMPDIVSIYEELGWLAHAMFPLVQVSNVLDFANYVFLTDKGVCVFDGYVFGISEGTQLPEGQLLAIGHDGLQAIRSCGLDSIWAIYRQGPFMAAKCGFYTLLMTNPAISMPDWEKLRESAEYTTLFPISESFFRVAKAAKILPSNANDGHTWINIFADGPTTLHVSLFSESVKFSSTEPWNGEALNIRVDADWLSLGASFCQYWGFLNDRLLIFSTEQHPENSSLIYYIPFYTQDV